MSGYSGQEQKAIPFTYAECAGRQVASMPSLERITKLAIRATGTQPVSPRAQLALIVGLDLQGEFFRDGILNIQPGEQMDFAARITVLRLARRARDEGDATRFTAFAAIAGFYPPELSNAVTDPADIVLDPIAGHNFGDSTLEDLPFYPHNSG